MVMEWPAFITRRLGSFPILCSRSWRQMICLSPVFSGDLHRQHLRPLISWLQGRLMVLLDIGTQQVASVCTKKLKIPTTTSTQWTLTQTAPYWLLLAKITRLKCMMRQLSHLRSRWKSLRTYLAIQTEFFVWSSTNSSQPWLCLVAGTIQFKSMIRGTADLSVLSMDLTSAATALR